MFGDLLHAGSESRAKGRVLCMEAELLPTRTAAGLPGCPFPPPLASPWCLWGAAASWSSQPVCLRTNWGVCYLQNHVADLADVQPCQHQPRRTGENGEPMLAVHSLFVLHQGRN